MQKVNWILVRGLAREIRHWGVFLDELQAHPLTESITSLELPGFGTKYNETPYLTIESYVHNLRKEFVDKELNDDIPNIIIGISLGGMITMKWMELYPDDFDMAVIINSSSKQTSPVHHRLSPEGIKIFLKLANEKDLKVKETKILQLTTNLVEINDEIVSKWASYEKEYPFKIKHFLRQILAASRFNLPKADKIKGEMIFLGAKNDRLVNYECSQKLAKYFKGKLFTHEDGGHDLTLDDPAWVIEKIKETL